MNICSKLELNSGNCLRRPLCRVCGSPDVRFQAWAEWRSPQHMMVLRDIDVGCAFCGMCDGQQPVDWHEFVEPEVQKIRALNVLLRRNECPNGIIEVSEDIRVLGESFVDRVLQELPKFDGPPFDPDEISCGLFEVDNVLINFIIQAYDARRTDRDCISPDPESTEKTRRVLYLRRAI